jgi:hypothetical protein
VRYARAMFEHRESEHPSRTVLHGEFYSDEGAGAIPQVPGAVALSRVINDLVRAQSVLPCRFTTTGKSAGIRMPVGFAIPVGRLVVVASKFSSQARAGGPLPIQRRFELQQLDQR